MSRARAARKPILGDMVSSARARFTGTSARKIRYVADLIRGLTVAEASQQLTALHRPSAVPIVSRVLRSAAANAEQADATVDAQDLVVGEIFADGGPALKRFQPMPMGRAGKIRKRMAHVTVKLYKEI